MTIATGFEQSLKGYPLIAPGTPDPYIPAPSGKQWCGQSIDFDAEHVCFRGWPMSA